MDKKEEIGRLAGTTAQIIQLLFTFKDKEEVQEAVGDLFSMLMAEPIAKASLALLDKDPSGKLLIKMLRDLYTVFQETGQTIISNKKGKP